MTSWWDFSTSRTPSGSQQELGGALRQVQPGTASRENAPHRVRPVCGQQSEAARTREAGDIQLSWLHAHLWEEAKQRDVHGAAADDEQEETQAKLKEVKTELRRRMHHPVPKWVNGCGRWLEGTTVTTGCLRTAHALSRFAFMWAVTGIGRCGGGARTAAARWERMCRLVDRWLPPPALSPLSAAGDLASSPKAGAGCVSSARPDLWRG